jgi:HK97 family phage major capsid protein
MKREYYLNKRAELMDCAEKLIDDGKLEEFKAKKEEVEKLDNQYELEAKSKTELDALNAGVKVTDIAKRSTFVKGKVIDSTSNVVESEDITNSKEYRKAFMNYVTKGTSIPVEFKNANANTKTTDIGEMIPDTVLQRIIEKMESVGMILPLVTRTAIKGGVTVPTSTVKPVASWVAEGATSDKQKKATGSITFAYHKLRCAVSVSLEVDEMALAVFETTLVNNVAEAMLKAIEQSILTGTGVGQPKGILSETVVTGQNVDIAAAADVTYDTLLDAEAALPLDYEREAVWFMTKKTFMKFIGVKDTAGQPIARVNYGINGRPERTLLGRTVVLNDYMTSLGSTISSDTVVAFLFNPKDYILNTNFTMGIREYYDEDTEDKIKKSVMLVDGKVVDVNSLVTVTKKA